MILPVGFHNLLDKDKPDKNSPTSSPPLRDSYEKGKINTGTHRLYKSYIFPQFPSPPLLSYITRISALKSCIIFPFYIFYLLKNK